MSGLEQVLSPGGDRMVCALLTALILQYTETGRYFVEKFGLDKLYFSGR